MVRSCSPRFFKCSIFVRIDVQDLGIGTDIDFAKAVDNFQRAVLHNHA